MPFCAVARDSPNADVPDLYRGASYTVHPLAGKIHLLRDTCQHCVGLVIAIPCKPRIIGTGNPGDPWRLSS